MSYTKGQWVREGTTVEVVQDGEGKMLVDVYGETQEETISNAHLIAAAPDLLDACIEASRVLSHIKDTPKADPLRYVPVSAYMKAYNKIKQAIAKAEGKD